MQSTRLFYCVLFLNFVMLASPWQRLSPPPKRQKKQAKPKRLLWLLGLLLSLEQAVTYADSAYLPSPQLTYTINNNSCNISWTSVSDATGYTLYYAPYPYSGPESVTGVDMGTQTSISTSLWDGSAFYLAVKANNGSGSSDYSNIEHVTVASQAHSLAELRQAYNPVALPNATFDALKTTPDGRPAMIFYHREAGTDSLKYWERQSDGTWLADYVLKDASHHTYSDVLSQNMDSSWSSYSVKRSLLNIFAGHWAGLFFTTEGAPTVLLNDGSVIQRRNGEWAVLASDYLDIQAAAMGSNNTLHALSLDQSGNMSYVQLPLPSTTWRKEPMGVSASNNYYPASNVPRFISMALDSGQHIHAVYTPFFQNDPVPEGGEAVKSELWYITNKTGGWQPRQVYAPPAEGYGDAGLGASIALRSDGQPAIASLYVNRVRTGSSFGATLLLHEPGSDDTWTTTAVSNQPDDYAAGDGTIGTGFAPVLFYDAADNPRVVFTDFAAQHFENTGQDEFSGNLRYAWRNGGTWQSTTVYRQTAPLTNQLFMPNLTILGNGRVAMIGQEIWQEAGAGVYRTSLGYIEVPVRP